MILYSSLIGGYTLPISLNIALHFGTLMAVFLFLEGLVQNDQALKNAVFNGKRSLILMSLFPALVLGTIPAGIIGLTYLKIN